MLVNGVVNAGLGLATGALDNAQQCKPYETDAPKNFVVNFALGAFGGLGGQWLANLGPRLQAWTNLQRALAYQYPPNTWIAPTLNGVATGMGNAVSNAGPFVP